MKKFDPLQELDTSPDSEFAKAVDFVVQNIIPDSYVRKPVHMGVTPFVLRLCDIEIGKMRTTYGAIEKSISEFIDRPNDKERYKHIHNIDPQLLKQIPNKICDPIAIIQSQTVASYSSVQNQKKYTKPNGLVILIELAEKQTSNRREFFSPVIAAVHIKQKDRGELDLNITSVHSRTMGFFIENLSSNLLMYLNRPKCRQFLNTFLTAEIRRRLNRKEDNERIQIIREMCDTKIHKDRSLNTGVTILEARSYIKESGHLYDPNNTQKPTIMQAIKEKISPKPKRSIPMPTGYKTEEDLQRFREEVTLNRPLSQDEAYQQTMQMCAEFVPADSPAYKDIAKSTKQRIENIYQEGKVLTPKDIQQGREEIEKKAMPKAEKEYHQAVLAKQQKQETQIQDINQNKGGRSL